MLSKNNIPYDNGKAIESMTLLPWSVTYVSLLSHKKQTNRGFDDIEFPGVLHWRKSMWNLQLLIKKEVGFPGVYLEKWCGISSKGFWFFALNFTRSLTKFCRISRDEALFFFLEFPRVKFFFLLHNPKWLYGVAKSRMDSKFALKYYLNYIILKSTH